MVTGNAVVWFYFNKIYLLSYYSSDKFVAIIKSLRSNKIYFRIVFLAQVGKVVGSKPTKVT